MIRRHLPTVALAGLAALLSACGTTVPHTALSTSPPAGASHVGGAHLPDAAGIGAAAATEATAELAGAAAAAGSSRGRGGPAASGEGAAPASRAGLRGITARSVSVGTYYLDTEQTNALIGSVGSGSSIGDLRAQQNAVAGYINGHGGVAGRRLQLVQHRFDPNGDASTEAQATCARWTEDNHVLAGLGTLPAANDVLVSCLAKAGTLSIGGTATNVGTAEDFRRHAPYYYAPASLEMVTVGRTYGRGLAQQGFFDSGARVGVLHVTQPEYRQALGQGLLPALAAAGHTPVAVQPITYSGGFSDYGSLVSQVQAAVLKFQSEGITHVLFLDVGSALAYWFLQQATNQGYAPQYGLSTLSAPSFLQDSFADGQLEGAVAVGWQPFDDVDHTRDLPPNPARALCQRIMRDAGLTPTSALDLKFQLSTCSGMFFLKHALDRAEALTAAGVQRAVSSFGRTNVPSAAGLTDTYRPGKNWGGGEYTTSRYTSSCRCFRYTGPAHPM